MPGPAGYFFVNAEPVGDEQAVVAFLGVKGGRLEGASGQGEFQIVQVAYLVAGGAVADFGIMEVAGVQDQKEQAGAVRPGILPGEYFVDKAEAVVVRVKFLQNIFSLPGADAVRNLQLAKDIRALVFRLGQGEAG